MRAHLVLKSVGGRSVLTECALPTSQNIGAMCADPSTVEAAKRMAESLGFRVVSSSPVQLTIEGQRPQFESVFSSGLVKNGLGPIVRKSGKSNASSAATTLHWAGQPTVPPELAEYVSGVVLPEPIQTHGSSKTGVRRKQ